ncbi:hypothetical protein ANN_04739 [Periplaneta americana]|uniref:Uncharacterized protein n=1 Tax=Periplaneta americana TaxID=6978 RepID=A0ABQ8TAU7_PERAM|nr:hypothetical protein ANN_04739 [Periplaneta americana]
MLARTLEIVQAKDAMTQSPTTSTRRLSRELDVAQTTVWHTLHHKFKKGPYYIQIMDKLDPNDFESRPAMCSGLLDAFENENLMDNVLFSDEAAFHICSYMNMHNCRIWAEEQPNIVREWQRDSPKSDLYPGEHVLETPLQSDTPWVCKYRGVMHFQKRFPSVKAALEYFSESANKKEAAEAEGLLKQFCEAKKILISNLAPPFSILATFYLMQEEFDDNYENKKQFCGANFLIKAEVLHYTRSIHL